MAWRALTDAQWERIRPQLPREKRRPQGGWPRADPRRCFEGILWVLWTGAPWSELPPRYGSPTNLLAPAPAVGGEWLAVGAVERGVPGGGHAPRAGAREPADRGTPERLIADRGSDSNAARRFLKRRGILPIIPARRNNTQATDQDGQCLRRYRRRRIVERTIGWLGNFRRLTVRYDRLLATYGGFFHLACALLVLRKVLK